MAEIHGKKEDGRGQHKVIALSDHVHKQLFLDWLCTPIRERRPKTMEALAEQMGVTRRSLSNWKADPEFLIEWENRYRKTVGSPERAQAVLDAMYATAIDRDDPKHVQAGKNYLEMIDAVKPKKMEVTVSGSARDLSDEQLEAILASKAAREIEQRAAGQ